MNVGVGVVPVLMLMIILNIVVVSATSSPIVGGLIVKPVILHGFVVIVGLVTTNITNSSCLRMPTLQSRTNQNQCITTMGYGYQKTEQKFQKNRLG